MLFDEEYLKRLQKLKLDLSRILKSGFQGQHRSSMAGSGMEFNDFRAYIPGDDYRYIDWNLYSRLGRLFIKLFQEEKEFLFYLLIDQSQSMSFGQPSKIQVALKLAGALGYIGLSNYDRIGASLFNTGLDETFKPGRGQDKIHAYLQFLENNMNTAGETDLNRVLDYLSYQYKKPGTVIILSDFLDEKGYQKGLRSLADKDWNIFIIQVLTPEEIDPQIEGDIRIVDIETEKKTNINIDQDALSSYRKKVDNFRNELQSFALHYDIKYIFYKTDIDFEDLILKLIKNKLII